MELINWLFELESALKIQGLTVHVAVNIIDRYLWKRQMVPTGMKLLGIGSLRIETTTQQAPKMRSAMVRHGQKRK
jgi:hypothetical protein